MVAKSEYRDRPGTQVAILDALVERANEGMTIFELRAHVDADIDEIEAALGDLKDEGLIEVQKEGDRVRIIPDDRVVPDPGEEPTDQEVGWLDAIRRRFGF